MMNLSSIRQEILKGALIEDVLSKIDWKEFEKTAGSIFAENDFNVKNNFRFKTKRKYEIDIVASRKRKVICADCKEWNRGRYKRSALSSAAKKQKQRTDQFEEFVKNNPIAKSQLKIPENPKFYPILVTLFEEDLREDGGVFVVPIWKLNTFLNEFLL